MERERERERERTRQRKQSHAQDKIYVIRQFVYVYGVAGISLLSRKIQSAATLFQSLKRRQQQQNPNHQNRFLLHPAHKIHNGLQNRPKNEHSGLGRQASASWTKPQ